MYQTNKGEKVPVKDINHLTPTDKERVKQPMKKPILVLISQK